MRAAKKTKKSFINQEIVLFLANLGKQIASIAPVDTIVGELNAWICSPYCLVLDYKLPDGFVGATSIQYFSPVRLA